MQNTQNCHKMVAIQPRYVLRAFGVFFKKTLDLSRKRTIRNIRVNYGGGGHVPAGGHVAGLWTFFKKVFSGVLRSFVVF